jgi:tRNA modification GTPase
LIRAGVQGKIIREGVNVVLAGRPNVGKSSLLNALLREERALVTAIPGTTRDTIEETVSIHGIPVHLVDTAGIRSHKDIVEELGVERARQKMNSADVILFLIDAGAGLTDKDRELYDLVQNKKHIVLFNKIDTCSHQRLQQLQKRFTLCPAIEISAKNEININELRELLFQIIVDKGLDFFEGAGCAPNTRHISILEKALESATRLLGAIELGEFTDLLAVETQATLDNLADIVGITTPDDVLDAIFNEFCIGK